MTGPAGNGECFPLDLIVARGAVLLKTKLGPRRAPAENFYYYTLSSPSLFSDWPKANSEFSKSAPVTS